MRRRSAFPLAMLSLRFQLVRLYKNRLDTLFLNRRRNISGISNRWLFVVRGVPFSSKIVEGLLQISCCCKREFRSVSPQRAASSSMENPEKFLVYFTVMYFCCFSVDFLFLTVSTLSVLSLRPLFSSFHQVFILC